MPRGIYSRKAKSGKGGVSRSLTITRETKTSKPTLLDVCDDFLNTLIKHDYILDENLFTLLNDEALSKGYHIEAHQRGIHGTHICFRK